MKPSKRRRWLRRVAVGLAVVGLVALPGGWLALRHVPTWYAPVSVPENELQRVRDSLTAVFRDVSDQMVAAQSFEMSLDGRTVTEWIVARGQIWPDSEAWIPPWLTDPVVVFVPGQVIVAAHLDWKGWESIVSVRLSLTVEGQEVVVRLEGLTCGALPVPLAMLDEPLDRLLLPERLDVEAMPDELASFVRKLRQAGGAALFTDGIRFQAPFIWKNGDRPYRIHDVLCGDGWLMLRIQPL